MDGIKDMVIVRSTYFDMDSGKEYDNEFAKRVHDHIKKKYGLDVPSAQANHELFNNKEVKTKIDKSVRGKDVYLIHHFIGYLGEDDPNVGYMSLIFSMDALKRASAESINVVLPSNPYERKDRKEEERTPISSKTLAKIIEALGAKRVLRIDMHAGQGQGFYDIPVDNLTAMPILINFYKDTLENPYVMSPDKGGTTRAGEMADVLTPGLPWGFTRKKRPKPGESKVLHVVGEPEGKNVVLPDDIIDTGGTLVNAATALKDKGALSVSACGTHGVFSKYKEKGKWKLAEERIMESPLDEVVITDTINKDPKYFQDYPKIKQVSVAPLCGDAIWRIQMKSSVSELFELD